ncbi:MAG: hypothetical protein Fur0036_04170 [Fimbriimonadaceae bacterium]
MENNPSAARASAAAMAESKLSPATKRLTRGRKMRLRVTIDRMGRHRDTARMSERKSMDAPAILQPRPGQGKGI